MPVMPLALLSGNSIEEWSHLDKRLVRDLPLLLYLRFGNRHEYHRAPTGLVAQQAAYGIRD